MSASIASSTATRPLARNGRTAQRSFLRATVLATALVALAAEGAARAAVPAFLGNWARGDGKTHIRVEPCGAEFCAVNTWVRGGHTGENVGDMLVVKVKAAGVGRWSGSAFDRKRNRNYTMTVHVAHTHMTTQGCAFGGMMCESMNWTRIGHAH
jgi:uncharacterized protein (DUF2147 family)